MKSVFTCLIYLLGVHLESGRAQSGKEIVQRLYQEKAKCGDPIGGNWVPLPGDLKCGVQKCDFPKEWCAIRNKDGLPDLFCEALSPSCQEALNEPPRSQVLPKQKIITSSSDKLDEEEQTEATTRRVRTTTTAPEPADESEPASDAGGTSGAIPCEDFHDVCCFWAASGECDRNPTWMKRTCRKSCGVCNCRPSNIDFCPTRVHIDQNCRWLFPFARSDRAGLVAPGDSAKRRLSIPISLQAQAPASLPLQPPPPLAPVTVQPPARGLGLAAPPAPSVPNRQPAPVVSCVDRQPLCRLWGSTGQCAKNPVFMNANCPVSCGLC